MKPVLLNREDLAHVLRGLLMGGADIIPGVSGGTVALVLGIYERLVTAVSHFDRQLIAHIAARRLRSAAEHIDLRFLIALAVGIAVGILSLASLARYLLEHHQAETLAAFFGLIMGSCVLVARMVKPDSVRARWTCLAIGALGVGLALVLVTRNTLAGGPSLGYTFMAGSVAICAMILPGISGAYILLLLGKYAEITGILKKLPRGEASSPDLVTLAVFAAGCAIGLILFSKLLRWMLQRWHSHTLALLCGFMIGSLYKIWPFQQDLTPTVEFKHKQFRPVWPEAFDGQVMACLAIAAAGVVAVLLLQRLAARERS